MTKTEIEINRERHTKRERKRIGRTERPRER